MFKWQRGGTQDRTNGSLFEEITGKPPVILLSMVPLMTVQIGTQDMAETSIVLALNTKAVHMLHEISMLTHFQKTVRSYLYQLKNAPFF